MNGYPIAIGAGHGRIAIVTNVNTCKGCDAGTFVNIVDGSGDFVARTRVNGNPLFNAWVIAKEDRFVVFTWVYGAFLMSELGFDGQLLSPPVSLQHDPAEVVESIVPMGARYGLFGYGLNGASLGIFDPAEPGAIGQVHLDPGMNMFTPAPGIGESAVTITLQTVRGEEMEGASMAVRELLAASPVMRRRSF